MKRRIKIISVLVMIPLAIYFWPAALGGDTSFLIVQGKSMLPTILPGSLIVTKEAPEYHIDDIVAYEQREGRASKIVVHRIIDETENGFVIKGDNNPKKDAGFPNEDVIIGKIAFSTPYVGDLLGLFKNPAFLIVEAIALTAIQWLQKNKKEKREKFRCRMLGIPYIPLKVKNEQKKPKKPDYSMFFGAIVINIVTFVLTQISIENEIRVAGDFLTGFLYRGVVPGMASVLIFAFYFGIIFGLYFLAKSYDKKLQKTRAVQQYMNMKNPQGLVIRKKSNIMLTLASAGWLLFILMSVFNLISMASDIAPLVN